jgi:hypothetical protein
MKRYFTLGDRREVDLIDQYFYNRKYADLYFFEPGFQFGSNLKYVNLFVQLIRPVSINTNAIQYRKVFVYFGISMTPDFRRKATPPRIAARTLVLADQ